MKKIVLGVVVLLIAAPVWADTVNIDVNDEGSGIVSIEYSVSDANLVRAFALNISVDNGATIDGISDYFTGESGAVAKGYGIFPGGIVIDSNGDVEDYNTPVAPPGAPDAPGQLGSGSIVVEMGSLYVDNNSPATSGRLFRIEIGGGASDCNLCISSVNTLRGGIVMEDTSITATPNLPGCVQLTNLDCYTGPEPTEWANVGKPDCWCVNYIGPNSTQDYRRQCHGDAAGDAQGRGGYWAGTNDLNVLVAAWQKNKDQVAGQTYPVTVGGNVEHIPYICADFDHLPQGRGAYRVGTDDLNILVNYWQNVVVPDPNCP